MKPARRSSLPVSRAHVAVVRPSAAVELHRGVSPVAGPQDRRRVSVGWYAAGLLAVALVGLATVRGTLAPFAWGATLGGGLGFVATLVASEVAVGRARDRGRRYWQGS